MSEVFLSYARSDRDLVEALARDLEEEGIAVWWDRSISAGEVFDEAIQDALNAAKCVVVLWSRRSVGSRWVRAEATEGADRGILIPIVIEHVRVPLAFRRIQAVTVEGSGGSLSRDEFAEVVTAVRRVLAGLPPPAGKAPTRSPRPRPIFRWLAFLFVLVVLAAVVTCLNNRIGQSGIIGPEAPVKSSRRSPERLSGPDPDQRRSS